jgi:hypothetical protein
MLKAPRELPWPDEPAERGRNLIPHFVPAMAPVLKKHGRSEQ